MGVRVRRMITVSQKLSCLPAAPYDAKDPRAGASTMLDAELQFADVLLKQLEAVGSSPHYSERSRDRKEVAEFQKQCVGVAQRLPSDDALDEDEDSPLLPSFRPMLLLASEIAQKLLKADVTFGLNESDCITYGMLDLLRTAARGSLPSRVEQKLASVNHSREWSEYCDYRPMKEWMIKEQASAYAETYTAADVMDAVMREGQKRLLQLSAMYLPPRAAVLKRICVALNMMALPLLFDTHRLRVGAYLSAAYACEEPGCKCPPFGTSYLAPRVFEHADGMFDCAKVCRITAMFLAMADMGTKAYGICEVAALSKLYSDVGKRLRESLRGHDKPSGPVLSPNKAIRLVMGEVAVFAESVLATPAAEGSALALRMALNVPCLHPSSRMLMSCATSEQYDGGTLSVWDAVKILVDTRLELGLPALETPALLATVFAGVVYKFMAFEKDDAGPFLPSEALVEKVRYVQQQWPAYECKLPTRADDAAEAQKTATALTKTGRTERGKQVSANVSICAAITGGRFKNNKERSATTETRYCGAISMLSTAEAFRRELRRLGREGVECRPADGIAPLKRLYVAALGTEPAVVHYMRMYPSAGNPLYEDSRKRKAASLTEDSDAIESPWRELSGAAILLHGLHSITTNAFRKTLMEDWKPLEAVKNALAVHNGQKVGGGAAGVMTPAKAMRLLSVRARAIAVEVFNTALVDERKEGSENKQRIMEQQLQLANSAFSHAEYSPVWEAMIQNLVTNTVKMRSGKVAGKKQRVKGGAPKTAKEAQPEGEGE